MTKYRNGDHFLDNVTGDLYSYNSERNEWIPISNVGIHHSRAAQTFDSIGKFIIKAPTYKPNKSLDYSSSYISKDFEDICYPRKLYAQHWILQDVPFEFKIPSKNAWQVHQFNFVNPEKTFIMMGESSKGPQIIYFDSFCVGTLFNIDNKYPSTVQILENFINGKLRLLRAQGKERMSKRIQEVTDLQRQTFISDIPKEPSLKTLNEGSTLRKKFRAPSVRIIRNGSANSRAGTRVYHSGLAITNHDGPPLFVENNAIRSGSVIKSPGRKQALSARDRIQQDHRPITSDVQRYWEGNKIMPWDHLKSSLKTGRENYQNRGKGEMIDFLINDHDEIDTEEDEKKNIYHRIQKQRIMKESRSEKTLDVKGKAEIMSMLYPDMPQEILQGQELWVRDL